MKYVTRNDRHVGFKKEDLAVGIDLSLTALIIFITHTASLAKRAAANNQAAADSLAAVPWLMLAFIVGIWAISTLVRKLGWQRANKLHVFWGIILPDAFGLFTLLFVVNWMA